MRIASAVTVPLALSLNCTTMLGPAVALPAMVTVAKSCQFEPASERPEESAVWSTWAVAKTSGWPPDDVFGSEIGGAIHALSLKTKAP